MCIAYDMRIVRSLLDLGCDNCLEAKRPQQIRTVFDKIRATPNHLARSVDSFTPLLQAPFFF